MFFLMCDIKSGVLHKPESNCYKPFQMTNLEERISEGWWRGRLGLCSAVEVTSSCFPQIRASEQNVMVPFVFTSGGENIGIVEALTNIQLSYQLLLLTSHSGNRLLSITNKKLFLMTFQDFM